MTAALKTQETPTTFTHPPEVVRRKMISALDELTSCTAKNEIGDTCKGPIMILSPYAGKCQRCDLIYLGLQRANQYVRTEHLAERRRRRWRAVNSKEFLPVSREHGGRVM